MAYEYGHSHEYYKADGWDIFNWVQDWSKETKIHESRLIDYRKYIVSENPIFDGDQIDTMALVMMIRANNFIESFNRNIREQLVSIVENTQYMSIYREGEEPTNNLNEVTRVYLLAVGKTKIIIDEALAIISEYIFRHFPDDAHIVESDNTRFTAYNWFTHIISNDLKPAAYGFIQLDDPDDWYWENEGRFESEKMPVTQRDFLKCNTKLLEGTNKINYAIETACKFVNFVNWHGLMKECDTIYWDSQDDQRRIDSLLEQKNTENDLPFFNRFNECTYRKKKYELNVKLPKGERNYSKLNKPYWEFKKDCPPVKKELSNALYIFRHDLKTVRFKGKDLENWKKRAKLVNAYSDARRTVNNWYNNRIEWVEDKEACDAIEFLIKHRELFEINYKDEELFIADQRICSDAKSKGEELPKFEDIKTSLEAKEQLGPHLEKLGLKIVPMNYVDQIDRLKATYRQIGMNITAAFDKIRDRDDFRNYLQESPLIKSDYDFTKLANQMAHNLFSEKSGFVKPNSPINVTAEIVATAVPAFDDNAAKNQKLKEYKGTELFEKFHRDLGNTTECTPLDITKAHNKSAGKENMHYVKQFCKKHNVEPVHGDKPKSKLDAMLDVFPLAYNKAMNPKNPYRDHVDKNGLRVMPDQQRVWGIRKFSAADLKRGHALCIDKRRGKKEEVSNEVEVEVPVPKGAKAGDIIYSKRPCINSSEMNASKKKFKEEVESAESRDLDKIFEKHLKKIVGKRKADTQPWIDIVENLEGRIPINKKCKFNTEQVAVVFCENHNLPQK